MNQRYVQGRHVGMSYGRSGGLWTAVAAVLSSILVIVLAVLFSVLFLGLFVAIALGVAVRAWLLRASGGQPSQRDVIDAEYTVVDDGDRSGSRRPPRS